MKDKKTYNELKEEYKREFERVILEIENFRDNTDETYKIKEFEVPLPPKYLIDKKLKTETYVVHSTGFRRPVCNGPIFFDELSYSDFPEGSVKKENIKMELLFVRFMRFIPDRFINRVYDICFVNNDRVLKTLSERKEMKKRKNYKYLAKKAGGVESHQLLYSQYKVNYYE
jgi:hypothetical protein